MMLMMLPCLTYPSSDAFNTTIVDLDSSANSAVIPDDAGGQTYAVLTTAVQGEALDDKK